MIEAFDRQLYVDLKDENDSQRMRARLEWQRRTAPGRQEERQQRGSGLGHRTTAPRSLPSGPAPNWTGLALSLVLLGLACTCASVVLGLWLLSAPARWVGNLLKRGGI